MKCLSKCEINDSFESKYDEKNFSYLKSSASKFFLKHFSKQDENLIKQTTKQITRFFSQSMNKNKKEIEIADTKRNILISAFNMMKSNQNLKKIEEEALKSYEKYLMFNPFGLSKLDHMMEEFLLDSNKVSLKSIKEMSNQFHHYHFLLFLEDQFKNVQKRIKQNSSSSSFNQESVDLFNQFIREKKEKAYADLTQEIINYSPRFQNKSSKKKEGLKRINRGSYISEVVSEKFPSSFFTNQTVNESEIEKIKNAKRILKSKKTSINTSCKILIFLYSNF
jgi:hypothetical protein